MVTVGEGFREVKHSGSHFIHRMESGFLVVYDWFSGPAMSEQQRVRQQIAESETARRFPALEY